MTDKWWYHNSDDDAWTPTREATRRIDSGFYEVVDGMVVGLKRIEVQSDDLIDLPGTIVDDLYADIVAFMGSKARYTKCGLTHKRGYMLYGPPGGGKTSVGRLLANRFVAGTDGIVVYVSSYHDLIKGYELLYDQERDREAMFLIEECDSFVDYPAALGVLDGEKSAAGKIFVAMTNYVDSMPPRIINRPGRFDMVVEVKAPPTKVQLEYLRRIRERDIGGCDDVPATIVRTLDGMSVTLAHLREAYVSHVILGHSLDDVAARFKGMQELIDDDDDAEEDDED